MNSGREHISFPRDQDLKYLRRMIKKGLVILLGSRGIGKTWLINKLYKENIIDELIDLKSEVFKGYSSYVEILDKIINSNGIVGIDHIEILPKEYKMSSFMSRVLMRMEDGGIISTHWRGILNLAKQFGINYSIYLLSEIPIKNVFNEISKLYADVDPQILWRFSSLLEGYPSAIIFALSKYRPDNLIYFKDGFWILRWTKLYNIKYIYNLYPELYNVKKDLVIHKLLCLSSLSRPHKIYNILGPKANVYLSRLYINGILDRIKTIGKTYYYIRDPIARLHILFAEPRDLTINSINNYVGINYMVTQLLYKAQNTMLNDIFGKQLYIGNITNHEIKNDTIFLHGDKKVVVKVTYGVIHDDPLKSLYKVRSDIKILFLIGNEYKRRAPSDIYIFDDSIIGVLSGRLGFERVIS